MVRITGVSHRTQGYNNASTTYHKGGARWYT